MWSFQPTDYADLYGSGKSEAVEFVIVLAWSRPDTESARDQGFLAHLKAGTPLRLLAPQDALESSDARLQRTIPATLIEKIVTGPERVVAIPIEISNAIIDGPLNLRHVSFKSGVTITDCEFTGTVDFSFSTFEHNANFSGSKFTDRALFRAARIKCDLRIDETTFANDSKFTDIHVDEVFSAEGTTFGSVDFHRMEVTKRSSFQPFSKTDQLLPTRFTGDARFGGANFKGNADFSGTQFEAKADFNGVRIGRNAFFRAIEIEKKTIAARFAGDVEIASGSELVPTQDPAPVLGRLRISNAGYASFHRLAGFVLVPLGVLVLTGLLRRQAKP